MKCASTLEILRLKEKFSDAAGGRRASTGAALRVRQRDVAKIIGVSPRWYEVFEGGKHARRFSAAFVARVADGLRLDLHERAALNRLALPEVAEAVEYFERFTSDRSPNER